MFFDCINVILKYCFFKRKFKKTKESLPAVRVDLGAFGSVVGCVTDEATRTHTDADFLIYIKKESTLYGLWGNFIIEFHRISRQSYANIIFFI